MKNYKKAGRKLLSVIMPFVLLGTTACNQENNVAENDKNDSSSHNAVSTTADQNSDSSENTETTYAVQNSDSAESTENTETTADNTTVVDMTALDENSEYGAIYYTPADEQHIVDSDSTITKYVDNEILIVANETATHDDIAELAGEFDAEIIGEIEITGDYQLRLNKNCTINEIYEMADTLESDALVDYAYPNYVSDISTNSVTNPPDGLNYGNEWRKDIQEYDGKGKSWGWESIHTHEAWEYLAENEDKVNKDLRIGLIDSGFYTDNQMDLEFAATFYDNNNNNENRTDEDKKHGTHVAGTMAATADNEKGICGVYPYGKGHLYGVSNCTLTESGGKYAENQSLIISYKINLAELLIRNVKVINISSGYTGDWVAAIEYYNDEATKDELTRTFTEMSDIMGEYLQRFIDRGYDFVIVNSSGNVSNSSWDLDNVIGTHKTIDVEWITTKYNSMFSGVDKHKYPEVYDRIIVVGSVNSNLELSNFSNIGERVDVYAPGGDRPISSNDIYSTFPKVEYDYDAGTSMAAPHVSGVAAMAWAVNSSLTGPDVKRIICESGKRAADKDYTFGIPKQLNPDPSNGRAYFVNAAEAVDMALHSFNIRVETEPETEPENGAILCWVVDARNEDKKLEGAVIEAIDENDDTKVYEAVSDEEGHFELILPEGTYSLTVKYDHYEDYVKTGIQVSNEGVNYLDDWIKMIPFMNYSEFSGTYSQTSKGGYYNVYFDDTGEFIVQYEVDNAFASTPTTIQKGFKGRFGSLTQIDDHTYSLIVEDGESMYGNEQVQENGVTYDRSESDIKVGSEFRIYTKDAPDSVLPITVTDLKECAVDMQYSVIINLDYSYILYDVSNDRPFFSEN